MQQQVNLHLHYFTVVLYETIFSVSFACPLHIEFTYYRPGNMLPWKGAAARTYELCAFY